MFVWYLLSLQEKMCQRGKCFRESEYLFLLKSDFYNLSLAVSGHAKLFPNGSLLKADFLVFLQPQSLFGTGCVFYITLPKPLIAERLLFQCFIYF